MTELKKGRPSWRPAEILTIHNLDRKFRYRWAQNDTGNLQRLIAEGWETCSELTDKSNRTSESLVQDGKKLTTVDEYRELIKLRLPVETAEERNAYYQEQSAKQVRAIKHQAEAEMSRATNGRASVRGQVEIIR